MFETAPEGIVQIAYETYFKSPRFFDNSIHFYRDMYRFLNIKKKEDFIPKKLLGIELMPAFIHS